MSLRVCISSECPGALGAAAGGGPHLERRGWADRVLLTEENLLRVFSKVSFPLLGQCLPHKSVATKANPVSHGGNHGLERKIGS